MGDEQEESRDDEQSLFVPERNSFGAPTTLSTFGTGLNPGAPIFKPAASQPSTEKSSSFGQPIDYGKFGIPTSSSTLTAFGQPTFAAATKPETTNNNNSSISFANPSAEEKKPVSSFGLPTSSAAPKFNQPFSSTVPPQAAQVQPPATPSQSTFGISAIPKKEDPSALPSVPQPSISGFNFGKGTPAPAAAAPPAASTVQQAGANNSSSSVTAAPGIFTLSEPTFPPFPVGSLQSHDRKFNRSTLFTVSCTIYLIHCLCYRCNPPHSHIHCQTSY